MITKAYRILHIVGQEVLLCLLCDRYSANPQDLAALYCGYCHRWLPDVDEDYRRPDDFLLPWPGPGAPSPEGGTS